MGLGLGRHHQVSGLRKKIRTLEENTRVYFSSLFHASCLSLSFCSSFHSLQKWLFFDPILTISPCLSFLFVPPSTHINNNHSWNTNVLPLLIFLFFSNSSLFYYHCCILLLLLRSITQILLPSLTTFWTPTSYSFPHVPPNPTTDFTRDFFYPNPHLNSRVFFLFSIF